MGLFLGRNDAERKLTKMDLSLKICAFLRLEILSLCNDARKLMKVASILHEISLLQN